MTQQATHLGVRRSDGVDLHQFHLIAGDRWVRQILRGDCQDVPRRKRHRDEHPPEARGPCDRAQQVCIAIGGGTGAFEHGVFKVIPREASRHRFRNVLHVDRLQARAAATEQRKGGQAPKQIEDRIEKCIVGPEDYRRADDDGAGKG